MDHRVAYSAMVHWKRCWRRRIGDRGCEIEVVSIYVRQTASTDTVIFWFFFLLFFLFLFLFFVFCGISRCTGRCLCVGEILDGGAG